jgi:hypothetical protein
MITDIGSLERGTTVCLNFKDGRESICGVITNLESKKGYDTTSSYPGATPSVLSSYYDYIATLTYELNGSITHFKITDDDLRRKKYSITRDPRSLYNTMPAGWGIKKNNKRTHRKKGKSRRKRMTRSR